MRTKHYYVFDEQITDKFNGNSLNQTNWDVLRESVENEDFGIEESIERYETYNASREDIRRRAELVLDVLDGNGLSHKRIVSLGVGKAVLEWYIKRLRPEITVECTDYARKGVEKLKTVFHSADNIFVFDMMNGDYSDFADSVVMIYRISTEFDKKQWIDIFQKMFDSGITDIIFVPTELASVKYVLMQKKSHIANLVKRKKEIECGWIFSESEFYRMFKGNRNHSIYSITQRVLIDETALYLLKKTN